MHGFLKQLIFLQFLKISSFYSFETGWVYLFSISLQFLYHLTFQNSNMTESELNELSDVDQHLKHWKADDLGRSSVDKSDPDSEGSSLAVFFIVFGGVIFCSCASVCIRYFILRRAARRVRGPAMMPNTMMTGIGPAPGGMMYAAPQQTNCKKAKINMNENFNCR